MEILKVALSAISFATFIAVVGIFIAVRQLKLSVWLKAQELYTEHEFYKARREILQHFGFKETIPSRIGKNELPRSKLLGIKPICSVLLLAASRGELNPKMD